MATAFRIDWRPSISTWKSVDQPMRGDRLKQIRELKGYTQEQLAEILDMGNRQIWRYENNETDPGSEAVAQIARVLEVSTDFLLGLSDEPIPCLNENELSQKEKSVIRAWRKGDRLEALRVIINDKLD
jgi:transcriptional regulator with XRE-family HTH domain